MLSYYTSFRSGGASYPNKNPNMTIKMLPLILAATVATAFAGSIHPQPEKVPCAIADRQDFQIPDRVQFTGWVGSLVLKSTQPPEGVMVYGCHCHLRKGMSVPSGGQETPSKPISGTFQ
jgi:hypothetical protein